MEMERVNFNDKGGHYVWRIRGCDFLRNHLGDLCAWGSWTRGWLVREERLKYAILSLLQSVSLH